MALTASQSDAPVGTDDEKEKVAYEEDRRTPSTPGSPQTSALDYGIAAKPRLPIWWRGVIIILTCFCTFGNHWSNGLIVAMKTTIIKEDKINNSQFATLVAVTNLVNTFLCIGLGFTIDKFGGALLSIILASFHFAGSAVMAGAATNHLNSYALLIVGKTLAAIGDGSLDNAQHRIFSTYFAPGQGFGFSIGMIWGIANLAQFTGQSTANIITKNTGTYAWTLWISTCIAGFSVACAFSVFFLDKYLRRRYTIKDQTSGLQHTGAVRGGVFSLKAIRHLPLTFWLVVLFAIFENAGVQSFVSISTQFAQQRLKKGAVIGGWVSSFYLLLPACATPFIGIFIDMYGNRISFLFASGLTFLISMLLLKFSHSVPAFIAAYIFYALSQVVTPAPQVEIIRNIIPDPQYFATGFAIKKSVVQASIVIITTAAGKLQDDTASNSLDPAVSLWLAYAFISVAVSGTMLAIAQFAPALLPAARLSQVRPSRLPEEVDRLFPSDALPAGAKGPHGETLASDVDSENEIAEVKVKERILKSPRAGFEGMRWAFLAASLGIIFIGWIMFGLGVGWGVHGSVIAGTTGE
ncbi:MFS general substrate transporter [Punctularia strigosozonata HHB-11173 SS5]|uniref:MFS general substrate transporter n=1 Tax=Punctularia strigosozonata (strain HHB-11173) TaxID=741275 RepID=UPI0004416DC7|nr:MFS general substrate transporter [Punctularia strigosozonata HHB-11173 SS5]EIN05923.1 MFS general substrate transporter [Punctularia strigosozonata HHB-11173 SS5]